MRKRGMQLGKKAVVALSCAVIGLGSVMLAKADGVQCPDCGGMKSEAKRS